MKRTLLLAGLACLFASQAMAETENYFFKPYVGIDYVHSWIDGSTVGNDAYGNSIKLHDDDAGASEISIGAKFHNNFSAEAFYVQSDKIDSNVNVKVLDADNQLQDFSRRIKFKYKAVGLDFISSVPVVENFELLGSLGVGYYKVVQKSEITSFAGLPFYANEGSKDSNKWGVRVGFGAQYNITDYLAVRGMVRISRVDSIGSFTDLTAGVRVYF